MENFDTLSKMRLLWESGWEHTLFGWDHELLDEAPITLDEALAHQLIWEEEDD